MWHEKLSVWVNLAIAVGVWVGLVVGFIQLTEYKSSEKKKFTAEIISNITSPKYTKTLMRLESLAASPQGGAINLELAGVFYRTKDLPQVRLQVNYDLNYLFSAYKHAAFHCRQDYADPEIIIQHLKNDVNLFLKSCENLKDCMNRPEQTVSEIKRDLAIFVNSGN